MFLDPPIVNTLVSFMMVVNEQDRISLFDPLLLYVRRVISYMPCVMTHASTASGAAVTQTGTTVKATGQNTPTN